jgi:hypothetical protein
MWLRWPLHRERSKSGDEDPNFTRVSFSFQIENVGAEMAGCIAPSLTRLETKINEQSSAARSFPSFLSREVASQQRRQFDGPACCLAHASPPPGPQRQGPRGRDDDSSSCQRMSPAAPK